MTDLWTKLKQRKLVQWAVAYVAFSFALLQGIDLVAQPFGWPPSVLRLAILVLAIGFILALLLAWYHGEQGRQRVSGTELMIISLVLAFGGVLLWFVGRSATPAAMPATPVTSKPVASTASASSVAHILVPPATSTAIPAKSIAVLPFENLSTDKANAYFADGMQDLILTKLADIGALQVVSRTSTMKYASHPDDLKTVGRQLGVAAVLEGSVQKAGNQVLINVQLIDTRTDHHLWAQSYQRTLDNIFGVEGEVAEKIATALKANLTPKETSELARAGTHNKQALDAYLRASFYAHQFMRSNSIDDWTHMLALLKQAVAIDPDFVHAWNQIAWVYSRFPGHDRQQREAVQRVLQLAPDNAEGHREMAFLLGREGKSTQALAEARRALQLAPDDWLFVAALGSVQAHAGQFDASIANFRKALSMQGGKQLTPFFMVNVLMQVRRYDEARERTRSYLLRHPDDLRVVNQLVMTDLAGWGDIQAARAALQAAPASATPSAEMARTTFAVNWFARDYAQALKAVQGVPSAQFPQIHPRGLYRAWALQKLGRIDEAKAAFAHVRDASDQLLKTQPDDSRLHSLLALALSGLGQHAQAIREAHRAMALTRDAFHHADAATAAARVETAAGDAGAAIATLRKLLDQPAGNNISVPLLKLDPAWDPLRKDPRFQALLKFHADSQPATVPAEAGSG